MLKQRIRRGGEGWQRTIAALRALRLPAVALALSMLATAGFGCAQAEKVSYMRHLTTVVEASAEVPQEAVITFDIDRKKVQGALATGADR